MTEIMHVHLVALIDLLPGSSQMVAVPAFFALGQIHDAILAGDVG